MKDNSIFNDLKEIQKEMFRLLGEVSVLTANPVLFKDEYREKWQPRCDIFLTNDELIMIFELAGVDKKSINIASTDEYIKVSGNRAITTQGEKITYYNLEIESGSFERKIFYPVELENYNEPEIGFSEGMLVVKFKLKKSKERFINIS